MALHTEINLLTFDESDVQGIPLPNQMPPAPTVPNEVREKAPGSFESVLSQNQDLMTRLGVALRHNMELEKQVGQYIERNRYLELQAHSLHSEMSQMSKINKDLELEFVSLREQRDSAERMYSEFHTQAYSRIERMANQLVRFQSYRRKIRSHIRPAIKELRATLEADRKNFSQTLEQNLEMRAQIEQFKKQLNDAYTRIQSQYTEHSTQQKQLVENYEIKIGFFTKELEFHKNELENIQRACAEFDKKNLALIEVQSTFENRAIVAERRYEGLRVLTDQKIEELRQVVAQMTSENTSLRLHQENAQQQIVDLSAQITDLKNENKGLQEQYNGLQILWEKSSLESEEAQKKLISLQKLNRDLSQALNERRRESDFLQEQLKQVQNKSAESLQSVYEHIKTFTHENAKLSNHDFGSDSAEKSNEIIERIKAIVQEVQSGPAGKLDL